MSPRLGHEILDRAKAGADVSETLVLRALHATGDLGGRPCESTWALLIRRDLAHAERRFTGAPITGFGGEL